MGACLLTALVEVTLGGTRMMQGSGDPNCQGFCSADLLARDLPPTSNVRGKTNLSIEQTSVLNTTADEPTALGECFVSKLRPDRHGSQIHDMIFAWAFARKNGMRYAGAVGAVNNLGLKQLVNLLQLPWGLFTQAPDGCPMKLTGYRDEDILAHAPLHLLTGRTALDNTGQAVIAVHVRRGDVEPNMPPVGDSFRYMPNAYYLDAIRAARSRHPGAEVHIFSEKGSSEPWSDFSAIGCQLHLATPLADVWRTMIQAREVILSRSSFSYVPALFATGRVTYVRFWHPPHSSWYVQPTTISPGLARLPATAADMVSPDMEESVFACEQHGSVETHICVLDKDTSTMVNHFPHFSQTALPCWHWFLAKRATNCVIAATHRGDKLSQWSQDLVQGMGCTLRVDIVQKCAVVGRWRRPLGVGPGETYDWAVTKRDTHLLQQSILSRTSEAWRGPARGATLRLGLLQRSTNRRLVVDATPGVAAATSTSAIVNMTASSVLQQPYEYEEVYFEKLPMVQQALWLHQQDIIVTPHGAAVTNGVFVRPCTVLVQVYPKFYYPFAFFEPLVASTGGIPLSWYPGADVYATGEQDAKQKKEATAAFKVHNKNRGALRAADAHIPQAALLDVLKRAVQLHQACLKTEARL